MRYDTSELHTEIKELSAENKRLRKQDQHREKIWKKRVAELEAKYDAWRKDAKKQLNNNVALCTRIAELEERCKGAEELAHSEHKNMLAYRNRRIALRDDLEALADEIEDIEWANISGTAPCSCEAKIRALLGKESEDEDG